MNLDNAKMAFDSLYLDLQPLLNRIQTEQDTRFQIIDRVLVEVLGWPRSAIKTELHLDSGYADYVLGESGHHQLVVEAKRAGKILSPLKGGQFGYYKVNGPALKPARDGLEQAKRYCADQAVMFSLLTSGLEWIGFWAIRTDRKPPAEGMAAVFPTLEAIEENFATFYQLFSFESIGEQLYEAVIHEAEGMQLRPIEALEAALHPKDVLLIKKQQLAIDLQSVFKSFFGTIADDSDPELLERCFVESRESREADVTLQKITRELVGSVEVVDGGTDQRLQSELKQAAQSGTGEFVLIVGNKGAGKSTFINRFFRLVLDRSVRKRCLVLRVDLSPFNGDLSSLQAWMNSRLKDATEVALFRDGVPSFDDLKGAYFDEYKRWQKGPHSKLYARSLQEFDEKFGQWLSDQTTREIYTYFLALVRQATKSRKLMPCLIFDNADNHRQEIQEAVFQYAQSVFRNIFCFVICPVTDRTIWQLSKSGPLQSYDYQAFYLPVPSTKDVIARRVLYLQEKSGDAKSSEYFTAKGIRLTISDISAFANCVERVFISEEYIGRIVGWLSNHDIRRSLVIAQHIITSPWTKIEDIVKAFVLEGDSRPRRRDTIRALIAGEHSHYSAQHSEFVLDLFSVDAERYCSPLTRLSIVQLLIDKHVEQKDVDKLYVPMNEIAAYFEPCRLPRGVLRTHVQELIKWRLLETYDPTDTDAHDMQRLRVTPSGRLHHELAFATSEAGYMTEMSITTAIRDPTTISSIRKPLYSPETMNWSDWERVIWIFVSYLLAEDKRTMTLPSHTMYDSQRSLRLSLLSVWKPGSQQSRF